MWLKLSLLFLLFAAATTSSSSDLVNHVNADADERNDNIQNQKLHHVKELDPYGTHETQTLPKTANLVDTLKAGGTILTEHQKKYHLRAKRYYYNNGYDSYDYSSKRNNATVGIIVLVICLVCTCGSIIGIVVTVYCVTKRKDPPPPPIQYSATGPQFQPQAQPFTPVGPPPPYALPAAAGAPPPAQRYANNVQPT